MSEIKTKEFWASVGFSLAIIIVAWISGIIVTLMVINAWWSIGGSFTALGTVINVAIIIITIIVVILCIMGSYAAYIRLLNWYYAMFCKAQIRYENRDVIKDIKVEYSNKLELQNKKIKELQEQNRKLYFANQKLVKALAKTYGLMKQDE